jgi:tRNA threonylcarbamoyl adenosine modification protein YeaZ
VLVLALDTSTPTVTAAVVRVRRPHEIFTDGAAPGRADLRELVAQRTVTDPLAHVEQLMPLAVAALGEVGARVADVEAVVVGLGPGPFTGLRVGIATAAALGDALDVPVHGVPSHDGPARSLPAEGDLLVVTDARRREVYVTAYRAGARVAGPVVLAPSAVPEWLRDNDLRPALATGAAAALLADLDLPVADPPATPVLGLVDTALQGLLTGAVPGPLTPLYLRRPDATPPGARKSVL